MEATNIFDIIFSPVNLPLTIFTILMILFWIVSMVSGIDGDIDFDVDVDADVDIDFDADSGLEGTSFEVGDSANAQLNENEIVNRRRNRDLKWWQVFLIYFNFVGVPFLYTFTIFIFTWWLSSVIATILTHTYNNSMGYIITLALLIPALFLTKMFTTPLKPLFRKLNKDGDKAIDFLGRKGTSLSTIKEDKLGNAEIIVEGSPMNIYIKSNDGSPIQFRDSILIIRESDDKTFYFAQAYND